MTPKQADRIAARIKRALARPVSKRGKYRMNLRPCDLQDMLALAEACAEQYREQRRQEALLGPGDVMRELGCGHKRLHTLVTKGLLPCAYRTSGQRRFKRGDVQAARGFA